MKTGKGKKKIKYFPLLTSALIPFYGFMRMNIKIMEKHFVATTTKSCQKQKAKKKWKNFIHSLSCLHIHAHKHKTLNKTEIKEKY